jgi:hypothetical protein
VAILLVIWLNESGGMADVCTFQKHCRPFLRKQEQRMFRRNVLPLEASTNIRKRVTKKRNEKRTQRWSILLDEFRSRVSEIRQMMMAASAVDTVAKLLVAMLH